MSEMAGLFAEQELQQELGRKLLSVLPPASERVILECSVLSSTMTAYLDAFTASGEMDSIPPGDFFVDELPQRLRAVMYREAAGTWFSMRITVTADGAMDAVFNYDDEPDFGLGGVDPVAYVNDLKIFPRDEAHQPEWLRARLAEGHARVAQSSR